MNTTEETIHLEGKTSQVNQDIIAVDPKSEVDGGIDGWLTVIGAWFIMFAKFGYLYSYGVYQDFYTRIYLSHHSPSRIAWIGSFQLAMPFVLGILSGKLFDAGYFHLLQIVGSTLFVVSLFMLSLAKPQEYFQIFLSQGVGMGLGVGLSFIATLGISSHHFRRRKALALGIVMSGSSLGAVVFPIMINNLLPKIGFGQTVRATAYIVLGSLIIANCLMRTGYHKSVRSGSPPDIRSFLIDPPYLSTSIAALVSLFGFYFPLIYLQLYAVTHGIDETLSFYSIAILNASSTVGRIMGNWLADIYGPFTIVVPCTLITAGSIFSVFGIHNSASLVVVSIFHGLFAGAWLSVSVAAIGSLARRPNEIGARTGLALAFGSFGTLAAAPVQGSLLTSQFKWNVPIVFSGILLTVGGVFFGVARILLVQERHTQKV